MPGPCVTTCTAPRVHVKSSGASTATKAVGSCRKMLSCWYALLLGDCNKRFSFAPAVFSKGRLAVPWRPEKPGPLDDTHVAH